MKNMIKKACLFLLAILLNNGLYAQKKNYQVVAIGFYNLENSFNPQDDPNKNDDEFTPTGAYHYTEAIYKQKLHNIATVIQKLGTEVTPDGAAIIGHAEVEDTVVLNDLVHQPEIKDRHYKYVWFYGPDARGINTALIYNPKYFKVINAKPFPVNLGKTGGKETTRDILYVYGILAGDTINVLVNHWPSRYGGEEASAPKRAIAAQVDRNIVDSLMNVNPRSKIIIMGDLNDDPTDASVAKVLGAKGDKDDVKLTDVYNPWVSFYKRGLGTLGYNDSWNLFDQIMLSGAFLQSDNGWKFYKAEIFNKDFLKEHYGRYKGYPHRSFSGTNWQNGYSDHFPTIIYLIRAAK